jgi:hypothetical protein
LSALVGGARHGIQEQKGPLDFLMESSGPLSIFPEVRDQVALMPAFDRILSA